MLFTTADPITHSMATAIMQAVREHDPDALIRAEASGYEVRIDGDVSLDQARAALLQAGLDNAELQDDNNLVHIQGSHSCCGQCT
ncbi:MAG TPA: hypothetical protein VFN25_08100 [Dokdonella sp.]|uniref:hypothetical protein n=1 Tax=Dokdonella sp. TaxID=2291710 RepID=UPI002D80235A|nr:hypothetical protein [Dokdonella sp.]HET9032852.1 hypothetical protein [Dokdonella sp.]